jgi:hypothetical protein
METLNPRIGRGRTHPPTPQPAVLSALIESRIRQNWREVASRSGLLLEVGQSQPGFQGEATGLPVRTRRGWSVSYADETEYRVTLDQDRLQVEIPAPGRVDPGEHLLRLAKTVTSMVIAAAGFFPLLAAAIRLPQGNVAVFSVRGRGKSTLAAHAAGQGLEVLGDGLLPLTRSAEILPLTGSLLVTADEAPPNWRPTITLSDGRGWYDLPGLPEHTRLHALVSLSRGDSVSLVSVGGQRRLAMLLAAGFTGGPERTAGDPWYDVLLDITAHLPVWELQVPEGVDAMREAWPEIRMLLAESAS